MMTGWRDERGFSLPELLVAFAVLALSLAAVTTIQRGVFQAYVVGSNRTEVQQNVRVAVELMTREVRQTPTALTEATTEPPRLTFRDQDTGLAVTYARTGTAPNYRLTRSTNGIENVVIGGLRMLAFGYVYCTGCPATPTNVVRVDITMRTASEDTVVAGGVADTRVQVATSVRLRNI